MIKDIVSASNAVYKHIKSLRDKKFRTKSGEYCVEGIKSVRDAAASGRELALIAVSEEFYKSEALEYPQNVPLCRVRDEIFAGLCDTRSPQGVIAVIKMEETRDFVPDLNKAYVYCDGINDPGNLGTIIRTADAAGFGGVILSDGTADPYSPKTVRASMGSFFNIRLITGAGTEELKGYADMGFTLYGGSLESGSRDYRSADMTKPSVIVVGNEANGISEDVLKLCEKIKIPIIGKAESLNVSVAAGILMYELVSQRA